MRGQGRQELFDIDLLHLQSVWKPSLDCRHCGWIGLPGSKQRGSEQPGSEVSTEDEKLAHGLWKWLCGHSWLSFPSRCQDDWELLKRYAFEH